MQKAYNAAAARFWAVLGILFGFAASAQAAVDESVLTTQITDALTKAETVIGIGLTVLGAFLVVKLIKRAMNRST